MLLLTQKQDTINGTIWEDVNVPESVTTIEGWKESLQGWGIEGVFRAVEQRSDYTGVETFEIVRIEGYECRTRSPY